MRGRQLKIQVYLSWLVNDPQRRADYTAARRKLTNKEQKMYQQKGVIPKEENEILED
jgi:hypothetical protein|tara:strand:- start:580 stop:750 length:171 start_codon:yes stop_codon:yes gene_type:complete